MRSLTTENRKEVVVIGSFGLERRGIGWKAKGLGDQKDREFTVREESPGKWRVNGINSNGSRARRRFNATGLTEAVQQARVILYGVGSVESEHPQLDIATAFHQSIDSGGGSAKHKQDQCKSAGYFCDWCDRKGLTDWRQLRLQYVREYMNECFGRGLKASTVKHYLEPIRSTARFMAANWPEYYRDVCATLRLPKNAGRDGVYRETDGNPVLSFGEVLDFLKWLKSYEWAEILIPGVMLQGLCGLQLQEALRLRWTDVDLEAGTITIQDHPDQQERVKNPYRVRRLPVPKLVLEQLRSMRKRRGRVVASDQDYKAYGKMLKRAFQSWDPECDLAPKDLRNTLQSHAIEHSVDEGWNPVIVDRYVGHVPKSVAERHYFGDKKSRMVALFQEHVSSKIDALLRRLEPDSPRSKGHEKAQKGTIVNFDSLQRVGYVPDLK